MSKVVAFIIMQCETQSAFVLSQMISHKVWVFRKIYSFQCQTSQALSSINGLQKCMACRVAHEAYMDIVMLSYCRELGSDLILLTGCPA